MFKRAFPKNISKGRILSHTVLILLFIILRLIVGPSSLLILTFVIILILFRHSVEKIAAIMMSIGIMIYLLGADAEANRYFSFVYLLIVISLLRYIYKDFLKEKKSDKK
ncbi:MAG: hypothetical protein ACD_37C00188G0004 [uncultured bacterium]|nr:MAG: hypothetical protein ACD_37C00188G0004 [uncultured bacterium]